MSKEGSGFSRRDALLGISVLMASLPLAGAAAGTANGTPGAVLFGQVFPEDARYLKLLLEILKACLPVDLPRRQRCYVSRIEAAIRLVELPFAEASAREVAFRHRSLATTIIGFSDLIRDALPHRHPDRATLASFIDTAFAMNTRVVQAADAFHVDQQSPSPWSIC